jgi:hypothetical protein
MARHNASGRSATTAIPIAKSSRSPIASTLTTSHDRYPTTGGASAAMVPHTVALVDVTPRRRKKPIAAIGTSANEVKVTTKKPDEGPSVVISPAARARSAGRILHEAGALRTIGVSVNGVRAIAR